MNSPAAAVLGDPDLLRMIFGWVHGRCASKDYGVWSLEVTHRGDARRDRGVMGPELGGHYSCLNSLRRYLLGTLDTHEWHMTIVLRGYRQIPNCVQRPFLCHVCGKGIWGVASYEH